MDQPPPSPEKGGLLQRYEHLLFRRLEGPGGWLRKDRRTRAKWAILLTLECAVVFSITAYFLARGGEAGLAWGIAAVMFAGFAAMLWGLVVNPRRTARIAVRVVATLPWVVLGGFVVLLLALAEVFPFNS